MKEWIIYSLLALMLFSLWGIAGKLTTFYLKAQYAIIYEALGIIAVSLVILIIYKFKIDANVMGIAYSVLVGITGILGTLLYLLAMKKGNTAVVTFITALYPNMVLVFSYFVLKEPMSMQQSLAVLFAFISILLFTLG